MGGSRLDRLHVVWVSVACAFLVALARGPAFGDCAIRIQRPGSMPSDTERIVEQRTYYDMTAYAVDTTGPPTIIPDVAMRWWTDDDSRILALHRENDDIEGTVRVYTGDRTRVITVHVAEADPVKYHCSDDSIRLRVDIDYEKYISIDLVPEGRTWTTSGSRVTSHDVANVSALSEFPIVVEPFAYGIDVYGIAPATTGGLAGENDLWLGWKMLDPRIYVSIGAANIFPTHGLGLGLRKPPDLDSASSLYGDASYYPHTYGLCAGAPRYCRVPMVPDSLWRYRLGDVSRIGGSEVFADIGAIWESGRPFGAPHPPFMREDLYVGLQFRRFGPL
jgi:hypothetical protein